MTQRHDDERMGNTFVAGSPKAAAGTTPTMRFGTPEAYWHGLSLFGRAPVWGPAVGGGDFLFRLTPRDFTYGDFLLEVRANDSGDAGGSVVVDRFWPQAPRQTWDFAKGISGTESVHRDLTASEAEFVADAARELLCDIGSSTVDRPDALVLEVAGLHRYRVLIGEDANEAATIVRRLKSWAVALLPDPPGSDEG